MLSCMRVYNMVLMNVCQNSAVLLRIALYRVFGIWQGEFTFSVKAAYNANMSVLGYMFVLGCRIIPTLTNR